MMQYGRRALGLALCLATLLTVGCKDQGAAILERDPEVQAIHALVTGLPDHATRKLTAPDYWVDGSMPDKATSKRYTELGIRMKSDPKISGDTATATVAIWDSSNVEVDKEWSFSKVNGKWKINSAPLP
jgi:hypothetical protein